MKKGRREAAAGETTSGGRKSQTSNRQFHSPYEQAACLNKNQPDLLSEDRCVGGLPRGTCRFVNYVLTRQQRDSRNCVYTQLVQRLVFFIARATIPIKKKKGTTTYFSISNCKVLRTSCGHLLPHFRIQKTRILRKIQIFNIYDTVSILKIEGKASMIKAPCRNQPSRLFVIRHENDKLYRRTSEDGSH